MSRLYVNAYIVSRVYGGPEEGGWWYDSGEPIASCPIPTEREQGGTWRVNLGGSLTIVPCDHCEGKGEVEVKSGEDETDPDFCGFVPCEFCGFVPANCMLAATLIQKLTEELADEVGRRQELRVCLESNFACAFPESAPKYE